MSRRLLRSGRTLRVATLGHGGGHGTTVIQLTGSGRSPLATGGNGGGSRARGLPPAGPI